MTQGNSLAAAMKEMDDNEKAIVDKAGLRFGGILRDVQKGFLYIGILGRCEEIVSVNNYWVHTKSGPWCCHAGTPVYVK